MTLADQIIYTERIARVNSNAMTITVASDLTRKYINLGVAEFCKIVNGIPTERYLTLQPKFDVPYYAGFKAYISGGGNEFGSANIFYDPSAHLAYTATSYIDMGPASCASLWTTMLNEKGVASCSVVWSSSSMEFYLLDNLGSANYIGIEEPSGPIYTNWEPYIFNAAGTQSGSYFYGNFPEDSTVEIDLPTDFYSVEYVEWDGNELKQAPFNIFINPISTGTPRWYAIKNNKIRINPVPSSQKSLLIRYKEKPDDLETDSSDDIKECPLPTRVHMAPVYYAAYMIAEEKHEDDLARKNYLKFVDECRRYIQFRANQNWSLYPKANEYNFPEETVRPNSL